MEDFLAHNTYASLFLISFLAATVVPLGSEWLLATMVHQGFTPWQVVVTATVGNYLGACTTYLIGLYGGSFLIRNVLRIGEESEQKASSMVQRYGSWALLFSWLPFIGDPLCLAGGVFGIKFLKFSVLVIIGKLVRYATIAFLMLGGLRVMAG